MRRPRVGTVGEWYRLEKCRREFNVEKLSSCIEIMNASASEPEPLPSCPNLAAHPFSTFIVLGQPESGMLPSYPILVRHVCILGAPSCNLRTALGRRTPPPPPPFYCPLVFRGDQPMIGR